MIIIANKNLLYSFVYHYYFMVKELGVAYYGNLFLDHAINDLKEMTEHGCNSILIAMSEYDWEVWRKNIFEIAKAAKTQFDFNVYINLWSWGGIFGGEAPSFYLHRNVESRQIVSNNNIQLPAACPNTRKFKNYLFGAIEKIATVKYIDGFFWDEPHYYYLSKSGNNYSCRCNECQTLFEKIFNKPMPTTLTEDVIKFKEKSIINFLREISQKVKDADSSKKITVCLVPPPIETGISDWDYLCSELNDVIDVFGSDPYWLLFGKSLRYVEKYASKTVELARKYNLESQLWCLGFLIPRKKEDELREAIQIFDKYKVDSIFTWCYRGAEGMFIESHNPKKVWQIIGDTYNEIKRKYNL